MSIPPATVIAMATVSMMLITDICCCGLFHGVCMYDCVSGCAYVFVCVCVCVNVCVLVGRCLATKDFIGKLPAFGVCG